MKKIQENQYLCQSAMNRPMCVFSLKETEKARGKERKVRIWNEKKQNVFYLLLLKILLVGVKIAEAKGGEKGASSSLSFAEVCQMEIFQVSCADDQVLIIRTAELGRLRLGRCVTAEKFNVGCYLDVLPEMDRFCSGRQRCDVIVDDNSFKRVTPCHSDLKNHLWVTYECIKVTLPPERCDVLRDQSGIISSFVTETFGCGLTETPWIIEVDRGQRINVTLYDFGSGAMAIAQLPRQIDDDDDDRYPKTCRVYATIRETGQIRTVCGGLERVVHVFMSSSERVEVRILTTKGMIKQNAKQNQAAYFLLQYTAAGCPEPILSKGMWMKRMTTSLDTLTIGCDQMNLRWQLTCKGNEWTGSYGNCSLDKATTTSALGMPYAVSTVIIVIIAMTVSCVILTVGVLCIKKRMGHEHAVHRLPTEVQGHCDGDYNLSALSSTKLDSTNASTILAADASGNEYARMRLQRLADYADPPSYGFDTQSQSTACGYKYPIVEHVYESPDSLRREDTGGVLTNVHYTPRLQGQRQRSIVTGREGEEFRRASKPHTSGGVQVPVSTEHSPFRGRPGTPTKSKNAGNYSL